MTRLSCSEHHRPLVFDEAVEESRMVGTLSFEREESAVLVRFVCPEAGCREVRTVTR